uniref:Uncharacterized protein LOC114333018 n=1 Tax=Diabrotica virgifera virgifera TaxID=50390 RepID=A0A6P7G0M8_DIAVI
MPSLMSSSASLNISSEHILKSMGGPDGKTNGTTVFILLPIFALDHGVFLYLKLDIWEFKLVNRENNELMDKCDVEQPSLRRHSSALFQGKRKEVAQHKLGEDQ